MMVACRKDHFLAWITVVLRHLVSDSFRPESAKLWHTYFIYYLGRLGKRLFHIHNISFIYSSANNKKMEIILNGENLEVEHAENIKKFDTVISISEEAWEKIEKSRAVIEDMLDRGQTIYG